MYLIFDTETTGIPKNWNAPLTDSDNWPRVIQIAWQLHDDNGQLISHDDYLIKPEGFDIPYKAEKIHGISTELAMKEGISLSELLDIFEQALAQTQYLVGQNLKFDLNVLGAEYHRANKENILLEYPVLDTCTEQTATLCQMKGGRGGKFKLPTLTELHEFLFQEKFEEAHNATADVEATARCFFELIRTQRGFQSNQFDKADYFNSFAIANPSMIMPVAIKHVNLQKASEKLKKQKDTTPNISVDAATTVALEDVPFAHLHNHTQYSILQSTTNVTGLVSAAIDMQMPAVSITDTNNMMGAFNFVSEVSKQNKRLKEEDKPTILPIIGCELNVCENHLDKTQKDNGYQMVFLAKNKKGYHNLCKMSSIAHTQGFYYLPRIDREIVKEYKEDLIVLTGGLNGEISSKIANIGEQRAEEALLWWQQEFREDLYIELTNHGEEIENHINPVLVTLARKHQIKLVATNNTYYINQEDSEAHDVLLCVRDGEKKATPIGRGRGYRYGFDNQEYYFKSVAQMKKIFEPYPEAIINIKEVLDKIEPYELHRDILLPKFDIPQEHKQSEDPTGVKGENVYLKHLTYIGATRRYGETIDKETQERIDFELSIIEKTGYPGYFLIVQDFIREAREMGVLVGPGRGSAAGSVVAYCLEITNIDPIKYDLLFERFLNPDRISMPDIDIDFDDEGRSKVIDYVVNKYGTNQVAQIITYGTMAAKSSIRDTARVLDLPLNEAGDLANMLSGAVSLKKIFSLNDQELKGKLRQDEYDQIQYFKKLSEQNDLQAKTIKQACALEGTIRNAGTHACGVIITPDDITNHVPISSIKGSDMVVSQFDNNVVENAGLLKMDFLGLSTLTLIRDTINLIEERQGVKIDEDKIPLDDQKTYELFQKGETVGIFQYESVGMQKHMKELKPTVFGDLIAMNALYRPGPMEYIPSFIKRKHGKEQIAYDLPDCEEYLKETYGITVYQEQVMLLSQKLSGFTKGEADLLRKAMGKKIFALLEQLKPKFLKGGIANGHAEKTLEKIWKDWEAFASYAFNKSHSTCYAWIGYQTAYLKANYPEEFMAAVLSTNLNNIKSLTFFLQECKRMDIKVLGPDINESTYKFAVNKENAIRIGMGAVKGIGEGAVESIVDCRQEEPYVSIYDLVKRVNLRNISKRSLESLVLSGALDSFTEIERAQYFAKDVKGMTFLEAILRFGTKYQDSKNTSQLSLFGEAEESLIQGPAVPSCESWSVIETLEREKEVVGIYVSGHPLDAHKQVFKHFVNTTLTDLENLNSLEGRDIYVAGIVTKAEEFTSKKGNLFGKFILTDYQGAHQFMMFGEDYLKNKHYIVTNQILFMRLKLVKRYKSADYMIKFDQIELINNVLKKKTKSLTMMMNIKELEENRVKEIQKVLLGYQGDKTIKFIITHPEEKISIEMPSTNTKIKIENELLEDLDRCNVVYKLKG